jgi:phospho-N-acetylmuramoyl-pentapeptide-transferase
MINLLIAAATAFLVSVFGTPLLIRVLRARGIGQAIRDDGPIEHPHVAKAGTPTMGGIAIVGAATAGYLVAHMRVNAFKHANSGIALMALIIGMALVGFVDDYLGVKAHRNLGLRKRGKLAGQLVVGTGFVILMINWVHVSTNLSFARRMALDLGPWGWAVAAVFVIMATSNGVNLTDGMDGLAAGASAFVFAAFVVIAFVQFRHPTVYHSLAAASLDQCVIAGAMMGACAGFLWWNAAPARIFMGDTGALALGGAVAGLALLTHTILLLPILGGLYAVETLSVIAQVISFRGFGRRVLRMSPIHHHFEVGGWPEFTVVVRFWLFAGMCVALGLGIFYADFLSIPGVIE